MKVEIDNKRVDRVNILFEKNDLYDSKKEDGNMFVQLPNNKALDLAIDLINSIAGKNVDEHDLSRTFVAACSMIREMETMFQEEVEPKTLDELFVISLFGQEDVDKMKQLTNNFSKEELKSQVSEKIQTIAKVHHEMRNLHNEGKLTEEAKTNFENRMYRLRFEIECASNKINEIMEFQERMGVGQKGRSGPAFFSQTAGKVRF